MLVAVPAPDPPELPDTMVGLLTEVKTEPAGMALGTSEYGLTRAVMFTGWYRTYGSWQKQRQQR